MRLRTQLADILRRQPVQQRREARRQRQALGIESDAKPVADLPADRGVMGAVDLNVALSSEICHVVSIRFVAGKIAGTEPTGSLHNTN